MGYIFQQVGFIRDEDLIPKIPWFFQQGRLGNSDELNFGKF